MSKESIDKVILGDQSPWVGGFTRFDTVNSQTKAEVTYNVQDVDAPWAQNGVPNVQIKKGWSDYWSLANRHPHSFSVPGTRIGPAVQSLKSPEGLSYLAGPSTSQTIKSCIENRTIGEMVANMFLEELEWANRISEVSGNQDGQNRVVELRKELDHGSFSLEDAFQLVKDLEGVNPDKVSTFYDYFREDPVKLAGILPSKYYWKVSKEGYRHPHSRSQQLSRDEILVPKGPALPIEIAAKGHVLAFTGLSYLKTVEKLRDDFTPDIKLRFLKVQFDWRLPQNPVDQLWDVFEEKKRTRGQKVSKNSKAINDIKEYWHRRPTSISNHVLGGNLNPKLSYFEL